MQICTRPKRVFSIQSTLLSTSWSTLLFFCMYGCLLALLSGCGGSNSGESNTGNVLSSNSAQAQQTAQQVPAPQPARIQGRVGGLWVGKYQSSRSNVEVNVTGVITELGEIFFVYPENGSTSQVTEGTIGLNGGIIQNVGLGVSGRITSQAAQGFSYFDNTTTITTQLEGTLIEGQQLTLKESFQDDPSGVFTLRHDNTYNNNSSINKLIGDYSITNSQGITTSHKIVNTGRLTGGNSLDCQHNGNVSLIDSSFNLYRITMSISNCDSLNGRWRGYATLSGGNNNLNGQITFFIRSSNAIQSYTLERN